MFDFYYLIFLFSKNVIKGLLNVVLLCVEYFSSPGTR